MIWPVISDRANVNAVAAASEASTVSTQFQPDVQVSDIDMLSKSVNLLLTRLLGSGWSAYNVVAKSQSVVVGDC